MAFTHDINDTEQRLVDMARRRRVTEENLYNNVLAQLSGALGATISRAVAKIRTADNGIATSTLTDEEISVLKTLAAMAPQLSKAATGAPAPAPTKDDAPPGLVKATRSGAFTDEEIQALIAIVPMIPDLQKLAQSYQPAGTAQTADHGDLSLDELLMRRAQSHHNGERQRPHQSTDRREPEREIGDHAYDAWRNGPDAAE